MTLDIELNTPWNLRFDRDGTEDFGIICDADGKDLVASHLPSTPRGDRTLQQGILWLPEYDDDPVPLMVRQMHLMSSAPKLLTMLKLAVATTDPDKYEWVTEAREAIVEATSIMFNEEQAEPFWHLHRAGPRLYRALEACEVALGHIFDRYQADGDQPSESEREARKEAFAALCEARGEIAF